MIEHSTTGSATGSGVWYEGSRCADAARLEQARHAVTARSDSNRPLSAGGLGLNRADDHQQVAGRAGPPRIDWQSRGSSLTTTQQCRSLKDQTSLSLRVNFGGPARWGR